MKAFALNQDKYKDVKFFLIFIAFASAFNYYLTYTGIKLNGFLLLTYTLDTLQGWAAWLTVRKIVIYLDQKMPYEHNPAKRMAVQFVATTVSGMLVIIFLTELCAILIRGRMAPLNFYTFDLFIIAIWFFLMNGIYIGMHYYHVWQKSENQRLADKKLKATGFYVKVGKQDLLIPFEEIAGFYSDDGFSYLRTHTGKNYLIDGSLDKTEQSVPEELFFRINRKYLIHRQSITGYKRIEDGKLEVHLKPSGQIPDQLPVSRIRAVPFKKWFLVGQ